MISSLVTLEFETEEVLVFVFVMDPWMAGAGMRSIELRGCTFQKTTPLSTYPQGGLKSIKILLYQNQTL